MSHRGTDREGEAGNLPSGETYIVPYEGEVDIPSQTAGTLPVQHGQEVVLYEVEANRVKKVLSEGDQAKREAALLEQEPAYGNMAELGFGVLGDFGLEPIGQILLDEKLGFHIAFGRSSNKSFGCCQWCVCTRWGLLNEMSIAQKT